MRGQRPVSSVAAAGMLSVLSLLAWAGIMLGEDDGSNIKLVTLGEPDELLQLEQLVTAGPAWDKTPKSTDWPSTRNPLKDFDADFKGPEKGFPHTTGTADWPFTKNPLLGFDEGFRAKWNGWKGPEDNVYASMAPHYPYVETKMAPDQSAEDYPAWKNAGGVKEHNVYADYQFPAY